MAQDPVVAYDGGEAGLACDAPGRGRARQPEQRARSPVPGLPRPQPRDALAAAGAPADAKFYDYRFSFNGFAADLTPAQAAAPRAAAERRGGQRRRATPADDRQHPGRARAHRPERVLGDRRRRARTSSSASSTRASGPSTRASPTRPTSPTDPGSSGDRHRVYGPPPADWHGICQPGEQWSRNSCNNKLIGARWFVEGLPARRRSGRLRVGPRPRRPRHPHRVDGGRQRGRRPEHLRPRPRRRHDLRHGAPGAHRRLQGLLRRGRLRRQRPRRGDRHRRRRRRRRRSTTRSAPTRRRSLSPDAVAFLFAADAGVFVAASAGNAGPGAGTVGSPADGAVGHRRSVRARTAVSSRTPSRSATASSYVGGSVTHGVGPAPLVDGGDDCPTGSTRPR